MKNLFLKFLGLVVLVSFFQSCEDTFVEDSLNEPIELKAANTAKKNYIVVLNDNELNTELSKIKGYEKKQEAVKSASAKILKRAGITDSEVEYIYGTAIKGFSIKIPPGQLKKLQNDPSVSFIEEDQVVTLIRPTKKPGGTPGGGGGESTDPSQETPWGITRVKGGVDGTGLTAWIIDTGIDLNHPDLNVDASRSITVFSGRRSSPDDQNGHGTHVAGTIAAIDNEIGVIGVAAGATVVAVQVLDRNGSGSFSGVIDGIDYVAANGKSGDVANMSLGGGFSQAVNDAVITAAENGIKFALAAGNESTDANSKSPASANHPNIYTVSAMDINDNWAYFSNYGNPPIEYCAPGYDIKSTWKDGGYNTISGTSMASPHVAGLLLLGNIRNGGTVNGDPDGKADVIAIH